MSAKDKTLVVLDGMAYAFRAFYAVPEMSNTAGVPTNAVYGFLNALRRAEKTFHPDYAVVAYDSPGGSFRDEMLKDYKGHRDAPPEALVAQFPLIEELAGLLGWHVLKKERFEADDIIATLTAAGRKAGLEVVLMTSDKDILQLVGGDVHVYREGPKGALLYGSKEVHERYGVGPERIQDLLGLMGDSSDNIPGVPGVGEKTAAKLLQEHGSIEGVLKAAKSMKPGRLRENLVEHAGQARLSYKVAALHDKVPLGVGLKELTKADPDYARLLPRLKELELRSLLAELGARAEKAGAAPPPAEPELASAPAAGKVSLKAYGSCAELARGLRKQGFKAAEPIGVQLHPPEALPKAAPAMLVLGQGKLGASAPVESLEALTKALGELDQAVLFESKALQRCLLGAGLEPLKGVFDLSVAFYLHNSVRQPRDLAEGASLLGLSVPLPALQEGLFEPPTADLALLAASSAVLGRELIKALKKEGLEALYKDVEGPLIPVLAKMERDGIKIDAGALEGLDAEAQKDIKRLHAKALKAAGKDFNLNSPSQLADILFKDLGLKPLKKIKTGFSTDNEVLEKLSEEH